MVGKSLCHYEILEPLGKGGMGEVYRSAVLQEILQRSRLLMALLTIMAVSVMGGNSNGQRRTRLTVRRKASGPS